MRYVAVNWEAADGEARDAAARALCELRAAGDWVISGQTEGLAVLTPPAERCRVAAWGHDGFICGEIYRAADGAPWRRPSFDPGEGLAPFRVLCRDTFGRYVAILAGLKPGIFRDPSGGVDALAWQVGPLTIVSSDIRPLPPAIRPPGLRLEWNAIARCMGSASASTAELALEGVCDVAPGAYRALNRLENTTLLWSPSRFAARRDRRPDVQLAEELAGRTDVAVRALVGSRDQVAVEVSGGLDSAIVAGTIARLGFGERVTSWLNYFDDRPEGDERSYARAVTDRIGAALTEVHLAIQPLRETDFSDVAWTARPPMNALMPALDRDVTARIRSSGATALVSGQGGDAVFYQMPTPLILTDELRRRGPAALLSPTVSHVARMLGRSTWSVMSAAVRRADRPPESRISIAAAPKDLARLAHPWVREAASSSPAKRLQIAGLANAHVATGARRASQAAALLYPLFTQPVVEFCLGVPAAVLTRGGRERALARRAFGDRLPPLVVRRRKKGELTAFHAQTVAASLDFLRPHLFDGCLCEAGVIDRPRLEVALQRDHLLRRAGGGEILVAAALESWVRHWQRYIPDSAHAGRETVRPLRRR